VKAQASGGSTLSGSERGRLGICRRKDWRQQPNPGVSDRDARDISLAQVRLLQ
jgi:hypothetical protein